MGTIEKLIPIYQGIGDFFKKRCQGYHGFVFTGNLDLAKKIGLKAAKKTPFFNSNIECRLLEYDLYEGTRRKPISEPSSPYPLPEQR
jgi:putative N6-adenine-specific DNA methylase